MATVNKDFRIKAGLVVEGANATVNGEDIITTGSTTDNLTEGTTNKYFTDERAQDAIGNNIGGGLDYNDTTGSIFVSTDSSLEIDGMTDALKVNRTTVDTWYDPAGSAATAQANAENYADNAISTAVAGLAPNYITSTTTEFSVTNGELSLDQLNGLTQVNPASGLQPNNGYGTIEYVDDTVSGTEGLRIKSERGWVGSQIGGQLDLDAYRNVNIVSRNGDIVLNADGDTYLGSVGAGNDVATTGYADTAASNASASANGYTDTQLANYTQTANLDSTVGGYGYLKSADLTGYATETYVGNAIADVVGLAPAALDTLQELAAAFDNSPDTLANLVTEVGGKQNTLYPDSTIDIGGSSGSAISVKTGNGLTSDGTGVVVDAGYGISVNTNGVNVDTSIFGSGFSIGAMAIEVDTTTIATKNYVDGLASNYEAAGAVSSAINALTTDDIEEGTNLYFTDARAVDAITTETIYPPAVVINNLSKQVAATQTVGMIATVNGLTWAIAEYKSAKLTVKAKTADHTQLSEILVTLDGAGNVSITEYGIVYTDTELAVISADTTATDVRIRVTTVNPSTDVTVVGTLLV